MEDKGKLSYVSNSWQKILFKGKKRKKMRSTNESFFNGILPIKSISGILELVFYESFYIKHEIISLDTTINHNNFQIERTKKKF